jgi:hypothetical protein
VSAATYISWLLCAFASVALAAAPARRPLLSGMLVLSGAAAEWWWRASHPVALPPLAFVIALSAACALWSDRGALPAAVVGGTAAAAWVFALGDAGLPITLAIAIGMVPALLASYFAGARPGFAPPLVRDEALLLVLALALAASVMPRVVDGWRSAQRLNAATAAAAPVIPGWVALTIGLLVGTGGVYTLWKRA